MRKFRMTATALAVFTCPIIVADVSSSICEVSEDGKTVATDKEFAGAEVTSLRGGTVPYGLTSDWDNTGARRQVGGVKIADFNNDGWNDVFVGCYSSNSFPPYTDWRNFIHYNNGDGTLEAMPSWISTDQVSTTDVQVGDINGDTFLDIFCTTGSTSRNVIYFGSATGPSTSPGYFSAEPNNAFAIAGILVDIDHDGDLDAFTANQGFSENDPYRPIYGFINQNGVLSTVPTYASAEQAGHNSLAVADVDDDGWEDLAVSKWAGFQSAVYRNNMGSLQTVPYWQNGQTTTDRGVAFADIDDNGLPDLVIGRNPTSIYTNADGLLELSQTVNPPFFSHQEIQLEDIDQDGDPDLAEIHFGDGRGHLYLNESGTLATVPSWTFDATVVGTALAFGDLNNDGWKDLVLGYSGDPSIRVFYATPLTLLGDMNCDGVISVSDIAPFVLALTDPAGYAASFPDCDINNADVNGDDTISVGDIGPFVALLTS
ncbi:MAG: FG-GAP-like repeat-containing protein [Phycisphaerae bacterium]